MLSFFNKKIECSSKGATLMPILGLDIFGRSSRQALPNTSRLTDSYSAQLEEHRLQIKSRLSEFLENELHRLSNSDDDTYTECPRPGLSFLAVVRTLQEAQLWPPKVFAGRTLMDVTTAMTNIRPPSHPSTFCELSVTDKYHTCAVSGMVRAACSNINRAGKEANDERLSLKFNIGQDENGKTIGFTVTPGMP